MDKFKILTNKDINKYGIIIESEFGSIDPNNNENKKIISESFIKTDNGIKIKEPLEFIAILGKANVVNRNNRIYEKYILEREVEKYKEYIKTNQAVGECVPKGTKIFTKNGWVNIEDLKDDDEIYTLNLETNQIEIQKILKKPSHHYKDDLIKIKNESGIEMMVTKNHKIVLWDENNSPYILLAEDLYNKIKENDKKVLNSYIKSSGNWKGKITHSIKIGNKKLNSFLWAKFVGIYLSAGYIDNNNIIINYNQNNINPIKSILNQLKLNYYDTDNYNIIISDENLITELAKFGSLKERALPDSIKNLSDLHFKLIFDWMHVGNGNISNVCSNYIEQSYRNINENYLSLITEIALKSSYQLTINKVKKELVFGLDEIKDEYETIITIRKKDNGIRLYDGSLKAEKIPYDDMVYCVTVENGTWLMKFNDSILWTHNSDHPTRPSIHNKNVSHIIRDIWWDKNTILGKIEILMSPAFVEQGIISCEGDRIANLLRNNVTIGISLRGAGTLVRDNSGVVKVADDFDLICWDIVHRPSSPGSFLFNNTTEASMFVENENKGNDDIKQKLNSFLNKLKK
jgi:hypothetical protein